jgi:hypothetical protein
MKNLLFCTLLTILFSPPTLFAQSYLDLVSLRYQQTPYTAYKDQPSDARINEIKAAITLPIELKNNNFLLLGSSYNRLEMNQRIGGGGIGVQQFNPSYQVVTLQLGLIKNLPRDRNITFMLIPKLSSDFKELSGEDFQLAGNTAINKAIIPQAAQLE